MKIPLLCLALAAAGATSVPGQDEKARFNLNAPVEFSEIWRPNTTAWRELTATRTNVSLPLGRSDYRVSGPLINALRPSSQPAEPRPSRGRKLLSASIGLLSLAVPQKIPEPPATGPSPFAWRQETGLAWEATAMRRAASPGSSDNPITVEAVGRLISVGK